MQADAYKQSEKNLLVQFITRDGAPSYVHSIQPFSSLRLHLTAKYMGLVNRDTAIQQEGVHWPS